MAVFRVVFLYIGDREWSGERKMAYEVEVNSQWRAEAVARKVLSAELKPYGGPDNWAIYSVTEVNENA